MKNLISIIFILLGSVSYAQSKRTLERLNDNLVESITYVNGKIEQRGYYTIVDSNLIKHGKWSIYSNGLVVSRARFDVGKLVWVDTSNGRVTDEQIRVRKLERKVEQLEQMLIASKSQ